MDVADPTFGVDDLMIGIAIFVVVLLIVVVAPVVIVMAVLVAELLLLLLLLPLFVVLRMMRVGRWPIEVWSDRAGGSRLVHAEAVRGWRPSRERMRALSQALRTGGFPPP